MFANRSSRFQPSPLWGRGWAATGAFTSRRDPGEGVAFWYHTGLTPSLQSSPLFSITFPLRSCKKRNPSSCPTRSADLQVGICLPPRRRQPRARGYQAAGCRPTCARPSECPIRLPYASSVAKSRAFVKWNRRGFFVGAGFRRRGGSRTAPTSTSAYLNLAVTESLPLATLDKSLPQPRVGQG
jgi:hypothetical protein